MKEKRNPDLITDVGLTDLPFNMGCEEGGIEAPYRHPVREDSGEMETFDAPIDDIKDGLSAACVEALKIDTKWNWRKERFMDSKMRKGQKGL